MRFARLGWITTAIEYEKLSEKEFRLLQGYVNDFVTGKDTITSEKEIEQLFKGVQWRENKEPASLNQAK